MLSIARGSREFASSAWHTGSNEIRDPRGQRNGNHPTRSIAFRSQIVQEYLSGETPDGLARRHGLSGNLIRTWVDKYLYPSQAGDPCEACVCDEKADAANTIQEYEAAALERLVGK